MTRKHKRSPCISCLLGIAGMTLLIVQAPAQATPVYVDAFVAVSGDGSSWASAYASLRDAVDASGAGAELWIAAGRYLPDDTGDRTGFLALKANMVLLGGFTNGMASVDDRDPSTYPTIICGDVQNDGGASTNTEQIVRFDAAGCRLDGLVFQHAYSIETTNSVLGFRPSGVVYTTTIIANCVFSNHTGRVAHLYGSPTFTNCVFDANTGVNGGVIRIAGSSSHPKIFDCTFSNNTAENGGVLYYDSSADPSQPRFERCSFVSNTASSSGGVIFYETRSPIFEDCLFTNNTAASGGVFDTPYTAWYDSGLLVVNCDFIDNHATAGLGGVIRNGYKLNGASGGRVTFSNCLFSGNTASSSGGVYYSRYGTQPRTFLNCRFIANHANTWGGVAYTHNAQAASFTFENCDSIENTASQRGGFFYAILPKSITLDGCRLIANAALSSYGGALVSDSDQWIDTDVTVNNSLLIGNMADTSGGAIWVRASVEKLVNLKVDHSLFIGNRARTLQGGAIYISQNSSRQGTTRLTSSTFAFNRANNGGLAYALQSPLVITNSIAWGNTASTTRGDLFDFSGTVVPHLVLSHSSTDLPCDTISGSTADNSFIRGATVATTNAYQFVDAGGNRVGDPRFAPVVPGSLAGIGAFDLRTGLTELTVATPSLVSNAFADTALAIEGTNVYWIVSNTESSMTVMGNPSSLSPTAEFAILSPRLTSRTGRWTGAGWVADATHSPCIDAGPEAWDVGAEPNPNGGRINMGFDAGTAFASLSALPGTVVIIR